MSLPSPDDPPPPRKVPEDKQATEHLANERTFLAWVRTNIAVLSLGFVVAKFGVWLERMAQFLPGRALAKGHSPAGWSMPIGIGMMAIGALLTVLAAWHYHRVSAQIEAGKVEPAGRLVIFVMALVVLLSSVMIGYLFFGAR